MSENIAPKVDFYVTSYSAYSFKFCFELNISCQMMRAVHFVRQQLSVNISQSFPFSWQDPYFHIAWKAAYWLKHFLKRPHPSADTVSLMYTIWNTIYYQWFVSSVCFFYLKLPHIWAVDFGWQHQSLEIWVGWAFKMVFKGRNVKPTVTYLHEFFIVWMANNHETNNTAIDQRNECKWQFRTCIEVFFA